MNESRIADDISPNEHRVEVSHAIVSPFAPTVADGFERPLQ
jgi:hypothetical protein